MNIYEEPRMEICIFDSVDIVTASGELTDKGTGGNNGYNWSDWF